MWPSATALATATTAVAPLAERLLLRLEPGGARQTERLGGLGLGETDGLAAGRLRLTGELHVGRLALGLLLARLGLVGLDLHADLRARELRLHVRGALGLLHLDARRLGALLLLEGRLLLVGDLALGEHEHELLRERDVLDVDALGLDLVLAEVAGDGLERGGLHLAAGLDELDRLERLQRVAEVVAHRALQHLAHEVAHGADHRDHLRRLRVGHVDLHLQVDLEDESLAALADDRRQLRVEVVGLRRRVGPVEREDERGHDLRRVARAG